MTIRERSRFSPHSFNDRELSLLFAALMEQNRLLGDGLRIAQTHERDSSYQALIAGYLKDIEACVEMIKEIKRELETRRGI